MGLWKMFLERQASSGMPTEHPALARFMAGYDGSKRLLLIKAAARTGRGWFAASWIGDRRGEVHDWSDRECAQSVELESLIERLRDDAQLHVAIILPPQVSVWSLSSLMPSLVAWHGDLMLEPGEIESLVDPCGAPGGYTGEQIHELCGGWLEPATLLAQDPKASDHARRMLRGGLVSWLASQDPDGTLSEVAVLPVIDAPTVEAFFGEVSSVIHDLDELVEVGVVRPDGHGGWMIPSMVRSVLVGEIRRQAPGRAETLERAASNAVVRTHGIIAAAETAAEHRRWPALLEMLVGNWPDLFFNDPRKLGRAAALVPRFITEQTMYLRVAVRMLAFTGKEGMELQLPALAPDYASDRTAQRLYQDTERLYRKPNARALTVGMIELFHLRLGGLFNEVGASALRLRSALRRALEEHEINPSLVAFAELQAGISLQLAGKGIEARMAYESSFHWAQRSGKAFLLSDAAGKLALLNALEGNTTAARAWLTRHEESMRDVGWGRKTIAHTGFLARGYLAVDRVDFVALKAALAELPVLPNNDEFWAVHAYLIAMHRVNELVPESARTLIQTLRAERHYSSASPMAVGLLDNALVLVGALGREGHQGETDNSDPALRAFSFLLQGRPDAALAVLHDVEPLTAGSHRRKNLALYLDLAARNPAGPTPELLKRIRLLHRQSGNLADIALLRLVPGWGEAATSLELEPSEMQRLGALGSLVGHPPGNRPVLTLREQEILGQLRSGMTRREIAESGFRSENTVKTQMRSLYRKLGASNVDQMLQEARLRGL